MKQTTAMVILLSCLAISQIRPLPCCLILGHGAADNPIHAVVAVDSEEQMLWIITVYNPSEDEWDAQFKRRKKS